MHHGKCLYCLACKAVFGHLSDVCLPYTIGCSLFISFAPLCYSWRCCRRHRRLANAAQRGRDGRRSRGKQLLQLPQKLP